VKRHVVEFHMCVRGDEGMVSCPSVVCFSVKKV